MLKAEVLEERGRVKSVEKDLGALQVAHDVNMSKILASIQGMVDVAVTEQQADHNEQLRSLTAKMSTAAAKHKREVASLKRDAEKNKATALVREAKTLHVLNEALRAFDEASKATEAAEMEAASAAVSVKAANARAAELEAENEMLLACPSLLAACRALSVDPTSSRLTDGTGMRPGSSEVSERAVALLSINAVNCMVKVHISGLTLSRIITLILVLILILSQPFPIPPSLLAGSC